MAHSSRGEGALESTVAAEQTCEACTTGAVGGGGVMVGVCLGVGQRFVAARRWLHRVSAVTLLFHSSHGGNSGYGKGASWVFPATLGTSGGWAPEAAMGLELHHATRHTYIHTKIYIYLSGTSGSCQHGAFSHFFRLFSTFGVMHQNVVTLGGVCVCFSKSVGKRRFRNVWVGGGRWSQFCAPSCTREDTQGTGNGPGITHYSESDSLSSLPLSARAGTPLGHTSPCL